MKTVRTFFNLAEAGFASSMLEAAGVRALLADEQSFGASYGIATGGIRLQVEDEDFDKALQILETGPQASESDSPEAQVAAPSDTESVGKVSDKIPVGVFTICAVGFAVLAFAIYQSRKPESAGRWSDRDETVSSDRDHDGRDDQWVTYHGRRVVSAQTDRNGDGEPDDWAVYDEESRLESVKYDDNFDGKPDVWMSYANGRPATFKRDTDLNGQPDSVVTYANELIVREDIIPNETGPVLRRFIYQHGIVREEWVDENRDGIFDYKVQYDPFGTRSDRIPLDAKK